MFTFASSSLIFPPLPCSVRAPRERARMRAGRRARRRRRGVRMHVGCVCVCVRARTRTSVSCVHQSFNAGNKNTLDSDQERHVVSGSQDAVTIDE
jgi:hypothetical protein